MASCVTRVVGTSETVLPTESVVVTQKESVISYPGTTSVIYYTSTSCSSGNYTVPPGNYTIPPATHSMTAPATYTVTAPSNYTGNYTIAAQRRQYTSCNAVVITSFVGVPGTVETRQVPVTIAVTGFTTEITTVYTTSCTTQPLSPPPVVSSSETTTPTPTLMPTPTPTPTPTQTLTTEPTPTPTSTPPSFMTSLNSSVASVISPQFSVSTISTSVLPAAPQIALSSLNNNNHVGPIVGGILGGLAGSALLGIVIYHTIFKSAKLSQHRSAPGRDTGVPDQENGQPFNQNVSHIQEWSGNDLYQPMGQAQGQLMQHTQNLQNLPWPIHGGQHLAQMQNTQYPMMQEQTNQLMQFQDGLYTQEQGMGYPQIDAGQHALQGGDMPQTSWHYSHPNAGQHAFHGGQWQTMQGQGFSHGQLLQHSNTLQNISLYNPTLHQQSQQLAQTPNVVGQFGQFYNGSRGGLQMPGQNMHYAQVDVGQHGQHALHASVSQNTQSLVPGVHGAGFLNNTEQLQATTGMAQVPPVLVAASLGASMGAATVAKSGIAKSAAKSSQPKRVPRPSSSSTSPLLSKSDDLPDYGMLGENPYQESNLFTTGPVVTSQHADDSESPPGQNQMSEPSSIDAFVAREPREPSPA